MQELTPEAVKRRDEISVELCGIHFDKAELYQKILILTGRQRELEKEREYINVYGTLRP